MRKQTRYKIEALLLYVTQGLFRVLPPSAASHTGGWIARMIGPRMAGSRKARRNIELALPGKTPAAYRALIAGMWDNLGRVFAEYPHLEALGAHYTRLHGLEHLDTALQNNKPVIFIGGHLANWEIIATSLYMQRGLEGSVLYRTANNPAADKLLANARSLKGRLPLIAKSEKGIRQIIRELKAKRMVGILIDQKFNKGVAAPFFGRLAMTSTAFIAFAKQYDAVLIPVHVERETGCHFSLTLEAPLNIHDRTDADILQDAHHLLESWILKRPAQWLWLHRRWDSGHFLEDAEQG